MKGKRKAAFALGLIGGISLIILVFILLDMALALLKANSEANDGASALFAYIFSMGAIVMGIFAIIPIICGVISIVGAVKCRNRPRVGGTMLLIASVIFTIFTLISISKVNIMENFALTLIMFIPCMLTLVAGLLAISAAKDDKLKNEQSEVK